jgi:hypothetical protein
MKHHRDRALSPSVSRHGRDCGMASRRRCSHAAVCASGPARSDRHQRRSRRQLFRGCRWYFIGTTRAVIRATDAGCRRGGGGAAVARGRRHQRPYARTVGQNAAAGPPARVRLSAALRIQHVRRGRIAALTSMPPADARRGSCWH